MVEAIRRNPHYRAVSHYAMQIAPYLELFGRERVYSLTLERLAAAPREEMRALYRWLDVDPEFVPANLSERSNETETVVVQARGRGWLRRFRQSTIWAGIWPWVPPSIRAVARERSEREVDRTKVSKEEVIESLRSLQQHETRELGTLLGRGFPEWTTLWGAPDDQREKPESS